VWDPATGTAVHTLKGHTDGVNAVCPVEIDGRTLLATAGYDQTVRLWDPERSGPLVVPIHFPVTNCASQGRTVILAAGTGLMVINVNWPHADQAR
jgi:WD40 repeat protein